MCPVKDLLRPPSIQGGMRQRGDSCVRICVTEQNTGSLVHRMKLVFGYLSGKMQLLQAGWGEWGHKVLGDAPTSDRDKLPPPLASTAWPKTQGLARRKQKKLLRRQTFPSKPLAWGGLLSLSLECKICMAIQLVHPLAEGSRPQCRLGSSLDGREAAWED